MDSVFHALVQCCGSSHVLPCASLCTFRCGWRIPWVLLVWPVGKRALIVRHHWLVVGLFPVLLHWYLLDATFKGLSQLQSTVMTLLQTPCSGVQHLPPGEEDTTTPTTSG